MEQNQAKIENGTPLGIPAGAWVAAALMGGLLLVAFGAPIRWMVERWTLPESYYSHGFLVPPVALFFIWRDRRNLLMQRPERSLLGLACFLAGLLTLWVSGVIMIYFTAGFAMVLTLWGLCGFMFGRRVMIRLAFPMALLLFMVPPPLQSIDDMSMKLKLAVANVTIMLMDGMGIGAVRDGSTIYLDNAVVTVGNACSGLRSLISLLFLGVLFAAISPLSLFRRTVLFLSSMPIAIVANVARVMMLCLVAWHWGNSAVTARWGFGPLKTSAHDLSGYLIFFVAFVLLYLTLFLLGGLRRTEGEIPEPVAAQDGDAPAKDGASGAIASPAQPATGLKLRMAAVTVLLALSALASVTMLFPSRMDNSRLRTPDIPLKIGSWVGQSVDIDDSIKQILETNDVVQTQYYQSQYGNRSVGLAVVYSPTNRRVAHPPEVCFVGAGWEVSAKQYIRPTGLPEMVRLMIHHGRRQELVYYCFKSGGEFTSGYYRQQMNIVRNMFLKRSTASALVRFSTMVDENESEMQAQDRLLKFAREMMPAIDTAIR